MEYESPKVSIDTAALRNTHCQNNDALPQSVDGNEWKYYSIGAMDEVSRKVQKVSTHTFCPPKERDDCVARDELWRQFNGAMEERSRKVQKASTHIASCVAMDVAPRHGHNAGIDVDATATALHPEKETSIQRGNG